MKRLNDFLSGIPMTILGGVCLVFSLLCSAMKLSLPADPAWAAVVICGIPLLYLSVWRLIYNTGIRKISSALLISIAMLAAIAIGDLFAAGEVAFIMAIGAILEDKTTERAKKGLKKLISIAPQEGFKLVNGKAVRIKADEIREQDILRVRPGEIIPVDGIILTGKTAIDQSVLTGESLPVDKEPGDEVFCGTLNCFGAIDIQASRVGQDSSLQKLIRLVQEAEEKKAPMARIADVCASWLVPVALLIGIGAYVITGNIVRAVTVLVVFCPCALVLATPTAIMAAIGQAAKHGVIIKSGEALEKMGKVTTITFDKTGTLTLGALEVCEVVSFSREFKEETLLALAASAEARSEHPLGKAVTAYGISRNIPLKEAEDFSMEAGKGISARVEGKNLCCGNETCLREKGITIPKGAGDILEKFQDQGKACVLVAVEGVCAGVITLSDVLRPEAKDVADCLRAMGTELVLLTGDHRKTADYFARQVGITSVQAGLLPAEKAEQIQKLQKESGMVCMIGDGVNDAPALKLADVGVAMGSMGSDLAVEAADIALMSDDISMLPYLKRLSNATVRTIRLSITLSLIINFAAVTLSVLGILTPATGALVHNAGSVLVVLIAALLYDRRFE